jgi:hypothetical protein
MIIESNFKNHLDSHTKVTEKTETKNYTETKRRLIMYRSEYRHDRAAEVI